MINLRKIIDDINQKNGNKNFDTSNIGHIEKILHNQPKLVFAGHGIQSICFKTMSGYVVKCCIKRKNSLIQSRDLFLNTTRNLLEKNMPILSPLDILYENDKWMIYTQPMCRMINDVTVKFCIVLMNFLKQMILYNIKIADIYYRNFGIYQNKIVLFDYHDIENFDTSSCNFMITNLYSMFNQLGKRLGWDITFKTTRINHWDDVVTDDFGRGKFPTQFSDLLINLHEKKDQINQSIDQVIDYLHISAKQDYISYNFVTISQNGTICTDYPYKTYDQIFNLIKENHPINVLDASPCPYGLGLKIAQDFPNIQVTLKCSGETERNDTCQIVETCGICNIVVRDYNKPLIGERYDLIIYQSLLCDLLESGKSSELIRHIKGCMSKYLITEVPIDNDKMLVNTGIRADTSNDIFGSIFSIREYLISNNVKVNQMTYIEYCKKTIKRFLLTCGSGNV